MTSSIIDTLTWLGVTLNQYIAIGIFIVGSMGNLLNTIVFTRQTFSKQSCSLYFLVMSMNNLVMYLIGLSTRISDNGFHTNLFDGSSDPYCKIRTYFVYTLFAISSWFFVFAALDRYYSSNQSALKRRQFCSTRTALKFISLTIIVCVLVHVHIILYYRYIYKLNAYSQLVLSCTTNTVTYDIFFAFFMLLFYSLLPPILMTVIGFFTLNNMRKARQHIHPSVNQPNPRRDTHQLRKSLFIQILVLIILTTPHSCYWIYAALSASQNFVKTNEIRAYETLLLTVVRLLLYINYGSSFYIQMLVSKTFRKEFAQIFLRVKRHFRNVFAHFFLV